LSWWPEGLIEVGATPTHTFWDRYVQVAWISALVPESTWTIALDTVRRKPDTLAQMMMTLHEFTGGKVLFSLAAGEAKQLAPFGYVEDKPFTRLDETVQVLRRLWTSDEAFDFDGKTLQLRSAYMGLRSTDGTLPPLTTIGLSPRLRKISARYGAYVPVGGTVEMVQEQIQGFRDEAERFGRDPDELKFWGTASDASRRAATNGAKFRASYIAETEEDRETIRTSPLSKWPAVGGWIPVNREISPFGADYHYANDMVPTEWDRARVFAVLDKVPDEDVHYDFRTYDDMVDDIVRSAEAGIDLIRFSDRSGEIVPDFRTRLTDMYVRATREAKEKLGQGADLPG
jgi:alkanesulfonate monooxygenase SsuD/methylene tetrahydromethanopterin reductase-like flavin-dependent oxidoreductase (luciferase family)